jgi:DNA-binding CsgD family transcriptional regulator
VKLTPRERQIIDAVLNASSNRAIADRLGISEQSVKNRLTSVYKKLGVSNRLELVLVLMKKASAAVAMLFLILGASYSTEVAQAQARPSLDEAIQQVRAGDPLRALLTLNEVIEQSRGDGRMTARAHAVRAMAFLAMNQPERANAAVEEALSADAAFVPPANDVNPATIALFETRRRLSTADPEQTAIAAEKAGQFQQAFVAYLAAYQALPLPPPAADDRRLRERIIRVVQKLGTPPIIPPQALEHVRRADQLLEAEAVLGGSGGASSRNALFELRQAVRLAPWWPEAMFKIATLQQKLQQVDDAVVNLNLYKLADPEGYVAATAPKAVGTAKTGVAAAPPVRTTVPGAKATITVYRSSNFFASAQRVDIECNGQNIAELQNGRMIRFTAPAGKVSLKFKGDEPLVLDAAAGGEYFFRVGPGGMSFNTRAVSAAEGQAYLKEQKPKVNDASRTTSTDCKTLMP